MRIIVPCLLVVLVAGCGRSYETTIALPTTQVGSAGDEIVKEAEGQQPSDEQATNQKSPVADQTKQQPEFETVERTDEEWRALLSKEEYRILREKGTERPYVNKYDHHFEEGAYVCAGCGLVLFESDTKFNSGCGWPAFYASKAEDRVVLTPDLTLGMIRTEVTCARCDGHLGHIFDDAPQTPTGQRYCINSVSIKFISADKLEKGTTVVDLAKLEKEEAEPQE